jgi:hypothetical protein
MSASNILAGQFYREVPETGKVRGWTILEVKPGWFNRQEQRREPATVRIIRNDVRTATPEPRTYDSIAALITDATWVIVDTPERERVQLDGVPPELAEEIRAEEERRYLLIKPILDLGPDAYWPHVRMPKMIEVAASQGCTVPYLWQLLCAYWQLGGRIGLRPRHLLAGQKTLQERVEAALAAAALAAEQTPKKFTNDKPHPDGSPVPEDFFKVYKTGRKPSVVTGEGKPMTLADVLKCRRGAKRFLFRPSPDGQLVYCFAKAYERTLSEFYKYPAPNGATNPAIPSPDQFIKAVTTDPEFEELSVRIVGKVTAIRAHSKKHSTTRFEVLGPGHVLQVDDVKAKVIIVDNLTRRPIGPPRVFVGIDQWASCITGRYISVDESNFEGVCELILSIAYPKRPLSELGINPLHEDRPVPTGLFNTILGDNGPLGASLGDILPKEICNLDNTAAYRGDRKGDIESSFHAYLEQIAKDLPGFNRVDEFAGHTKAEHVACLTLAEFETIFDAWVRQYNNRPLDRFLPLDAMRLAEQNQPECKPASLYAWGLDEKTGYLKSVPEPELRKSLLRRASGTLRPRDGIKFKALYYLLDNDPLEHRFVSRPVEIRYSNRHSRQIFVWLDGHCHAASLRRDLDEQFGNLSFPEIERHRKHTAIQRRLAKAGHRKLKIDLYQTTKDITATAKKAVESLYPTAKVRKAAIKGTSMQERRKSVLTEEVANTSEAVAGLFPGKQQVVKSVPLKKRSIHELRDVGAK